MYGYLDWLWSGTVDGTPPLELLEATHHSGLVVALIRRPVQGISGVHARLPTITHHFQRVGGCGDTTLGDVGGSQIVGSREFGEIISYSH